VNSEAIIGGPVNQCGLGTTAGMKRTALMSTTASCSQRATSAVTGSGLCCQFARQRGGGQQSSERCGRTEMFKCGDIGCAWCSTCHAKSWGFAGDGVRAEGRRKQQSAMSLTGAPSRKRTLIHSWVASRHPVRTDRRKLDVGKANASTVVHQRSTRSGPQTESNRPQR
jgi:hypothetical protein